MKKLLENTFMLYLMQFAGYLFSLIAIPYQARVLSQAYYGGLTLAIGVMLYFQMVIDFGFMVTGVMDVAANRDDRTQLSRTVTEVLIIRIGLSMLCLLLLWGVLHYVHNYSIWSHVFYIYFLAVVLEALMPSFFLRGMEDMRTVAVLTVLSKAMATLLVFVGVKSDADYLIVPWCRVLGAAVSLLIASIYIYKKHRVCLTRVSLKEIWSSAVKSSGYFVSRIASTVYLSGNIAILGSILPSATIALYSSAEKLVNVGMTMCSPISDSLLPHISRTKEYSAAWKLLKFTAPILLIGGTLGFIFARPIVVLLFGPAYAAAAPILRIMIPIIAITLPNYVIAFPVLVPMGLGKQSNFANIIGAAVYCAGVLICLATKSLNEMSAAAVLLAAIASVTLWRTGVLLWHMRQFKITKEVHAV